MQNELMDILKANEIRGYSHYTKSKRIALLSKRGLIPEKHGNNKQEKIIKDIDPKHSFLRQIRKNPKKVEIYDSETIRLFFVLLNTRLLLPWNKIPV